MNMPTLAVTRRSPLREPMLWLVIALPLSAVIAGFVTLGCAVSSASDSVTDTVRRVAQVQTTDLSADERAASLTLAAEVSIDMEGDIGVSLRPPLDSDGLVLRFEHPADQSRDRIVALADTHGGRYVGHATLAASRYNLTLLAGDASWRLHGRLEPRARRAVLLPSVVRNAP